MPKLEPVKKRDILRHGVFSETAKFNSGQLPQHVSTLHRLHYSLYKLNTVKQSACMLATNYIDVNIHVALEARYTNIE